MTAACQLAVAVLLSAPRGYDGPTAVAAPVLPERAAPAPAASPPPGRPRPRGEPPSPFRMRWGLDVAVVAATAIPYAVLELGVTPSLPVEAPTGRADVGRLDRIAVGRFDPGAGAASSALAGIAVGMPIVAQAIEAAAWARRGRRGRRAGGQRFATHLTIYAEALSVTAFVAEALKIGIGRQRPLSYLDPGDVPSSHRAALQRELDRSDRSKSFPSEHSAFAFAAATAGSTLLTFELARRSPAAVATVWSLSAALAGTTAVLRVVAGQHFPTDVIAGSALGAGVGAAVVLLHLPWRERGRTPRHGDRRIRTSSLVVPGGAGLSLSGRL